MSTYEMMSELFKRRVQQTYDNRFRKSRREYEGRLVETERGYGAAVQRIKMRLSLINAVDGYGRIVDRR